MKSLHPDFTLSTQGGVVDAYDILWRGNVIGMTRPLGELFTQDDKDCFIVASGPSVNDLDLSRLRGTPCFGVNGSIVKSREADVPFRYHVILDRNFVRDRLDLVTQAVASGGQCAFSYPVLNLLAERQPELLGADNLFLLHQINAVYGQAKREPQAFDDWAMTQDGVTLHPSSPLQRGWVGFSKRLDLGLFSGQTVVFSALQLAYCLGYRRIFILGMDLGGPEGGFTRFYETKGQMAKTRLDRDFAPYIQPSFELAGKIAIQEGWEIYNVSPSSRLSSDILPKLTYEEALAAVREKRRPNPL